jgi:hypothetical protein
MSSSLSFTKNHIVDVFMDGVIDIIMELVAYIVKVEMLVLAGILF